MQFCCQGAGPSRPSPSLSPLHFYASGTSWSVESHMWVKSIWKLHSSLPVRAADKDERLPLERKAGGNSGWLLGKFSYLPASSNSSEQPIFCFLDKQLWDTFDFTRLFLGEPESSRKKQEKREKLSRQPLCDSGLRCDELEKKRVPESAEKIYNIK